MRVVVVVRGGGGWRLGLGSWGLGGDSTHPTTPHHPHPPHSPAAAPYGQSAPHHPRLVRVRVRVRVRVPPHHPRLVAVGRGHDEVVHAGVEHRRQLDVAVEVGLHGLPHLRHKVGRGGWAHVAYFETGAPAFGKRVYACMNHVHACMCMCMPTLGKSMARCITPPLSTMRSGATSSTWRR